MGRVSPVEKKVMFSHGWTFPRVTASGCRVTGDG